MSDNTSEMAEILSAKAWRPAAGESITGTVANLRRQDDEYGGHVVVTLNESLSEEPVFTAVHAFHSVLKKQLSDLKPGKGAQLQITYLGKVEGKNQPYHSYVVIDPTAEVKDFNWDEEPGF